ncbi:MAG: helix-turn-helix transcriptional regulator [Gemmatimonadales bacterium]|nr:helix-turn-helix transcriptional regulator [Gemmatimonadales bacterium]
MSDRDPAGRLPVRPRVFAILLSLAEGPRHGYGLMRELQETPAERWLLGPATLYRTLKEMEEEGLIAETEGPVEESDGPPRKYYRLTGFGRRVANAETERMRALVVRAGGLLLGGGE